jgi:hypothetical protein
VSGIERHRLELLLDDGPTLRAIAARLQVSAAARAEVAKCVLLCANCHAEVEEAAPRGRYLLL